MPKSHGPSPVLQTDQFRFKEVSRAAELPFRAPNDEEKWAREANAAFSKPRAHRASTVSVLRGPRWSVSLPRGHPSAGPTLLLCWEVSAARNTTRGLPQWDPRSSSSRCAGTAAERKGKEHPSWSSLSGTHVPLAVARSQWPATPLVASLSGTHVHLQAEAPADLPFRCEVSVARNTTRGLPQRDPRLSGCGGQAKA